MMVHEASTEPQEPQEPAQASQEPQEPQEPEKPARKRRKDAGKPRGGRKRPHTDATTEAYYRRKFEAPNMPDLGDVPAALRTSPGARDRAPKRAKADDRARIQKLTDEVIRGLGYVNAGLLAVAPCSCDRSRVPGDLLPLFEAGALHFDTCAKTWALDQGETQELAGAIVGEFESHPEWSERMMETIDRYGPHVALIVAIGGIVFARASRPGAIVPIVDPSQLSPDAAAALTAAIRAGQAAAAEREPEPARAFTEAAAPPFEPVS